MREISNHFCIIPQDLIREALKMGESVSIPVGSEEYSCATPAVFSQNASKSDSGLTYDQTFRAITADSNVIRHNNSKAYLAMIFTDGSVEIIGSAWSVPTIIVTPNQGAMVVEVKFSALQPVVL